MAKRVLIPTDFTIESLTLVKALLSQSKGDEKYDIILLHGVHTSESISELLFFSKGKLIDSLSHELFNQACDVIQNKFASRINSFRKDIFTGFTQTAFENYLEANKIDLAFIPENHVMNLTDKRSFDLVPFIKKSNVQINEIPVEFDESIPENAKFAEIFFSGITSN